MDKTEPVFKKKESHDQQRGRHIPATLRDQVYLRDNGQCSYVSRDGVRCRSRHNLQIDHIVSFAKGGTHEMDNLRLLCRSHNLLEAEKHFGAEYIKWKIKQVANS